MQEQINTQRLDEELNKLKAIGIKELSKSTKLSSNKIEDVLEKRYDQIDKVRAKGFIAILEREYGVDLRDWILAQNNASCLDVSSVAEVIGRQDEIERTQRLAQNVAKVEEKQREAKKSHDEHQKQREQQVIELALNNQPKVKQTSESFNWLYVILAILLIALMGYFAYQAFMKDRAEQAMLIQNGTAQQSKAEDTKESNTYDGMFFDTTKPQESLTQEVAYEKPQEVQISESSPSTQTNTQEHIPSLEPQSTSQSAQTTALPTQSKIAYDAHPEQSFFFNPSTAQNTQPQKATQDNILHIRSEYDLWLGVINLKNGTKEQFLNKKEYDITLDAPMLFVMGHGAFTLTLNGEEITHGSKTPVRMYYDGSSLTDIGYTKFKQLNGGAEW